MLNNVESIIEMLSVGDQVKIAAQLEIFKTELKAVQKEATASIDQAMLDRLDDVFEQAKKQGQLTQELDGRISGFKNSIRNLYDEKIFLFNSLVRKLDEIIPEVELLSDAWGRQKETSNNLSAIKGQKVTLEAQVLIDKPVIEMFDKQRNKLSAEIRESDDIRNKAERKVQQYQNDVDSLKAKIEKAQKKSESIQSLVQQAKSQPGDNSIQIDELTKQRAALVQEAAKAMTELTGKQGLIVIEQKKIEQASAKHADASKKNQDVSRKYNSLYEQCKANNARIKELSSEISQESKSLAETTKHVLLTQQGLEKSLKCLGKLQVNAKKVLDAYANECAQAYANFGKGVGEFMYDSFASAASVFSGFFASAPSQIAPAPLEPVAVTGLPDIAISASLAQKDAEEIRKSMHDFESVGSSANAAISQEISHDVGVSAPGFF